MRKYFDEIVENIKNNWKIILICSVVSIITGVISNFFGEYKVYFEGFALLLITVFLVYNIVPKIISRYDVKPINYNRLKLSIASLFSISFVISRILAHLSKKIKLVKNTGEIDESLIMISLVITIIALLFASVKYFVYLYTVEEQDVFRTYLRSLKLYIVNIPIQIVLFFIFGLVINLLLAPINIILNLFKAGDGFSYVIFTSLGFVIYGVIYYIKVRKVEINNE